MKRLLFEVWVSPSAMLGFKIEMSLPNLVMKFQCVLGEW